MLVSARFISQMWLTCALLSVSVSAIASTAVTVLPSTHALSLVIKEVTGETYVPLLPANVSPHDFNLKPSHIRRLQKAELVVWLGPELEPYLAKVMLHIPKHKQFIINQGRSALKYGEHPWTSPEYLLQGLQQLSQHLNKPWSSKAWVQQMNNLHEELFFHRRALQEKNQGYVVYHDGIGGFEAYFGLTHLASFTNADDQPPGAKQLAMIEQLANEQKVACILIDHEVRPKLVNAVLKPGIKRVAIDILAANSTSIIGYITQLQQALLSCGKV